MGRIHQTERLLLRQWREEDLAAYAAINADEEVMRHYPSPLGREESAAQIGILQGELERFGHGFWALELLETGEMIGFCGIRPVRFEASFTPTVEIGWRLAREHWGKSLAYEAAREALRIGFEEARLERIHAFTTPENGRSLRLMERLGMTPEPPFTFEHPELPEGHRLRRHLLYALKRADWKAIA